MALSNQTIARMMAFIPDKLYITALYRFRMKKSMNWKNPQSFTQKIQWLKVYNRNPVYTRIVDKYEMKGFVEERLGKGYTVPTIGLWNSVDEINTDRLPNKFVLKCTHDSGSNIICLNKDELQWDEVKRKLNDCMNNNHFYLSREWPYKNVKPRIIAEQLLEEKKGESLKEYKLFCFNGEVKMTLVCKGIAHTNDRTNDYCDIDLNRLPFTCLFPNSEGKIEKPERYDELLRCASRLSEGIPFVRVDAYMIKGEIYFGELTLFHNSGLRRYNPDEWDYKIGEWLLLPQKQ